MMVGWYVKSYHTTMIHITIQMWMVGDLKRIFPTSIIFSLIPSSSEVISVLVQTCVMSEKGPQGLNQSWPLLKEMDISISCTIATSKRVTYRFISPFHII